MHVYESSTVVRGPRRIRVALRMNGRVHVKNRKYSVLTQPRLCTGQAGDNTSGSEGHGQMMRGGCARGSGE